MARKLIEENWRAYERDDLPEKTGEVELKALRRAFFMGAVLLAPHLDEGDPQGKLDIAAEVMAFSNEVDRGMH